MKSRNMATALAWIVGLALCAAPSLAREPGEQSAASRTAVIALASREIDTREAAVAKALDVFSAEPGAEEYVLVKFPGPVTAAQVDALARLTERVYTYLPHDAFLVRMPLARQHELTDAAVGASWIGPYHPAYKISPAVTAAAKASAGAAVKTGGRLPVLLHLYPDAPLDDDPVLDSRGVPWPVFASLLVANGWFRDARGFKSTRHVLRAGVRLLAFIAAWIAAFAWLPTLPVALVLAGWVAYIAPKVRWVSREFQNVKVPSP